MYKQIYIILFLLTNTAFASEQLFIDAAKNVTATKEIKAKEKIVFDLYAEVNKKISDIEKSSDPTKDPAYDTLLEVLVFFEIVMDRNSLIKLNENRSCQDYKFYIDARIDPSSESGVSEDKYPLSAKWFSHITKALCKK